MKKLSILLSLMSIIILTWCTRQISNSWWDQSNGNIFIDPHLSPDYKYTYPEDTLYAYFSQHSNLPPNEKIGECYALRENTVSVSDVRQWLYSWIQSSVDPSERVNYSVSEIHNDHCRWGQGDPNTSPTIWWFLVVGNDVYEATEPWWSDYFLIASGMNNFFWKDQNLYPLDDSHPTEKIIFNYLQKEGGLRTGESAQHCFWLSGYEITPQEMSEEIFNSQEIIDNTKPFAALRAYQVSHKNCRWGEELDSDETTWWWTFVVIGDVLYRQLWPDEIDAAGGERWTRITL